ncbi:MAG: ABC transporter permease [Acidobacteria bacterium]|nr:MAG: ABC transporter permease [Acidobacteriota bacterium]
MTRSRSMLWLIARRELALSLRSRSIQMFAVLFAALALMVAASGYVLSGGSGFQDFSRTAASLVELLLLLVPLTALIFGVTVLTPDVGAAELLYSQPVERRTVLAGQLAGVFLALTAAQAVGLGLAGLVLFARTGFDGLSGYLGLAAGSVALTAVFLAIAAAIAAGHNSARRARALASAVIIWLAAVVVIDIAALGIASALPSGLASKTIIVSTLANPAGAVRTAVLMMIEGTAAFGSASMALVRFTGGVASMSAWLVLSILVWIVAPLVVATSRLRKTDL